MGIFLNDAEVTNALEEAVQILGGVIETSSTLRISNSAVYHLLKQGIVRTADTAFALEEATAAKGCRVPARELADRDDWRGPDRHPDAPRRRRKVTPETIPTPNRVAPMAGRQAAVTALHGSRQVRGKGRRRRTSSTDCFTSVQKLVGTEVG